VKRKAYATCEDGCAPRGPHLIAKRCLFCVLALAVMLSACTLDPNKKKLGYLNRGEKYFKAGDYRSAEIEFRNAIVLDPKFEQAHYQLARTYLKLSYLNDAFRELQTTVGLNSENSEAELQLAGVLLRGQQYQQAQQLAEKLVAADQRNVPAREMLGATYVAARDLPKALENFKKPLRSTPTVWIAI